MSPIIDLNTCITHIIKVALCKVKEWILKKVWWGKKIGNTKKVIRKKREKEIIHLNLKLNQS